MKNVTKKATSTSNSNWSEKEVSRLQAFATESGGITNEQVKKLALDPVFSGNKTIPMLRGKAISLKLYKAADPAAARPTGEQVTRKSDIVSAIETMLSRPNGSFATFEKASKPELEALAQALISLSDSKETA